MRQIILDTETTGLDPLQGHRIIEIGCVELEDRKLTGNRYQCYLNPEREVDIAAMEVHGITNEFLADKPVFAQEEAEFIKFVRGAELLIHNAPFDIGFLNNELRLSNAGNKQMEDLCGVLDTLVLARAKHPGQRNSLDALCKRYHVDNTQRVLHGALLDAEILADVYLMMTSGQSSLLLQDEPEEVMKRRRKARKLDPQRTPLRVIMAAPNELRAHQDRLQEIGENSEQGCLWLDLDSD
ncbi:MAG TPA: DNA polymerase III subunit epsilon [Porticoccaceae bacterium]|nr:DNA polymerase III subunit epsilon [Porticoccaceae bacterium]